MNRLCTLFLLFFTVYSFSAYSMTLRGDDVASIHSGEEIVIVDAYDGSTVNVFGGNVAYMYANDASTANISGGDISWLHANDHSKVNITFVDDLSWLLVNDNSEVHIWGADFRYSHGHLSGAWANGIQFSFWALEEELDLRAGSIGNTLPDNIKLNTVPIPSTILFFSSALASLVYIRKKSKK